MIAALAGHTAAHVPPIASDNRRLIAARQANDRLLCGDIAHISGISGDYQRTSGSHTHISVLGDHKAPISEYHAAMRHSATYARITAIYTLIACYRLALAHNKVQ